MKSILRGVIIICCMLFIFVDRHAEELELVLKSKTEVEQGNSLISDEVDLLTNRVKKSVVDELAPTLYELNKDSDYVLIFASASGTGVFWQELTYLTRRGASFRKLTVDNGNLVNQVQASIEELYDENSHKLTLALPSGETAACNLEQDYAFDCIYWDMQIRFDVVNNNVYVHMIPAICYKECMIPVLIENAAIQARVVLSEDTAVLCDFYFENLFEKNLRCAGFFD